MALRTLKNGVQIEDSGGEGPVVLCIHGLGGTSNTWTPVAEGFAGLRVLRLELPGSARSPLPQETLSMGHYVQTAIAALDDLGVASAHIAAHSMGTIISFHLAASHPTRVRSLALLGPLLAPPEAGRAGIRARAALARDKGVAGMQEIAESIVKGATSAETRAQRPVTLAMIRESLMRQSPEGYARSCEALAGAEAAAVDGIAVPTLMVTGDEDGVGSPAGVKAIAERIKSSTVVVLDGCGHWTTFEKPVESALALKTFYASLGT